MRGAHLLAHWCKAQQTIVLPSAESDLSAMCKATSEGLAAQHLGGELEQPHEANLHFDSSAAREVAMRQGSGKVKHLISRGFSRSQLLESRTSSKYHVRQTGQTCLLLVGVSSKTLAGKSVIRLKDPEALCVWEPLLWKTPSTQRSFCTR